MHTPTSHPHAPSSWQLHAQTAKMAEAGLYSSLLHPFLSEPDLDHPDALPSIGGVYLDPHSDEYFDKLVKALELDGPLYAKVNPNMMDQFKGILDKYPDAFHLPGTPLGTMKGFCHNIDTSDLSPVHQLPYRLHFNLVSISSPSLPSQLLHHKPVNLVMSTSPPLRKFKYGMAVYADLSRYTHIYSLMVLLPVVHMSCH